MNEKAMLECGICYFQGTAKDFNPTTASSDPAAPECPRCLNNDAGCFEEIKIAQEVKAA